MMHGAGGWQLSLIMRLLWLAWLRKQLHPEIGTGLGFTKLYVARC
jgi:hypothetical protein